MAQRVKDLALPQFKGGSYSSESIPDAGTYSMPQLWPKKKKKKLLKKSKVKKMINKTFIKSFFFFFFFFFFCHTTACKVPETGIKPTPQQ